MIHCDSKNLFGGAEKIFGTFRHFYFLLVKTTITTHYRAKLIFRLFGVDHPTICKTFGGPNRYIFFAEIKIRYGN
jgi:hypothetical protein